MYSVQQLQALDFLLKRITNENEYPVFQKNLKLVIEINNSLWYGDFVQMDWNSACQQLIDDAGDIDLYKFSATGNNAISVLKKIWEVYNQEISKYWSSPFKKIDNLQLLFETLNKLLKMADISEEDSPFFPYLHNAKSIDGNLSLPFINLEKVEIKLVSLIEIDQ